MWQFVLLQKNSIISISLGVTLIYGIVLFALKEVGGLDQFIVAVVLNDPSVIGYFFIALSIYTERKSELLPAIFVSPLSIHRFLLSRIISISIVGIICSVALPIVAKGMSFDVFYYTIGASGICILSSMLGLIMLTYADEFLNFALKSVPVFLVFVNIPLLDYLGVVDLGMVKYFFPVQGSLDFIDYAISGTPINFWYSYGSLLFIPPFYFITARLFSRKIIKE
jgi:fluoroquinolone transport system permease protein